jgi:aminoglycoside phosphotransferase (APT) family kinase protein
LADLQAMTGVPTLAYANPPEWLSGGFWAELLAFSLLNPPTGWDGDLVARVMPDAGLARKETIVQAAVAAEGFPTPAVRGWSGPVSRVGRAFMIMDRARGAPLLSGLGGIGVVAAMPRLVRRIPDALAISMARLHALDPEPVRDQLRDVPDVATSVLGLLHGLRTWAGRCRRVDLADAAGWLINHPPPVAPDVVCHGDLHPFNLLAEGDAEPAVLDWSAAVLAPRTYDVAFTSLLLSEPPIAVSGPLRPLVRATGRRLARRFVRVYEQHSNVTINIDEQRWYQAAVCLRALVEVAGWVNDGVVEARQGHPWLVSGGAFATRLSLATSVSVKPR